MGKDSSELLWDDINRPKFYSLLTLASAGIRGCLYPAALVKTRLQAAGTVAPAGPPVAGAGSPAAATVAVPNYKSTGDAFRTIARREGKLALYRGFRMNLIGLAVDPIVIGFIEYTRTRLTYYSDHMTPLDDRNYSGWFFSHVMSPATGITLLSAGGAACIGQIIQVPVDVISQKKQMQMHDLYNEHGKFRVLPGTSSLHIARGIMDTEGLRGLYKGFFVTLGVAMPYTALLWAVYWPAQKTLSKLMQPHPASNSATAAAKQQQQQAPLAPHTHTGRHGHFSTTTPTPAGVPMTPLGGSQPPPLSLAQQQGGSLPRGARLQEPERNYLASELQHQQQRELRDATGGKVYSQVPQLEPLLPSYKEEEGGWFNFSWRDALPAPAAAAIASASASLATQPVDVIKTRLQVSGGAGATLMSTVRTLLKERGTAGLMSGWYSRILVVSPQATIMMSAVEALKRYSAK